RNKQAWKRAFLKLKEKRVEIKHACALSPDTVHFCEDHRRMVCNNNGMLMLRHIPAPVSNQCPSILQRYPHGGGSGNESFNGHHRVFPEPLPVETLAVIGNAGGCLVQAPAYTVAGQVPDNGVACPFCGSFY